MASSQNREPVGLTCTVCGNFNYITSYNKTNELLKEQQGEDETFPLKKFCPRCNKRTDHKAVKSLK